MMMMFVSLFPAMTTGFSAKRMISSAEQSASPMATMGEMPRLQTLSTDAFTPVNAQRSGENPLEIFVRQTANKRLKKLVENLETSHLSTEQIAKLAAAFTARDNSGLQREIVPIQNQKEETLQGLIKELRPPNTEKVVSSQKKKKKNS